MYSDDPSAHYPLFTRQDIPHDSWPPFENHVLNPFPSVSYSSFPAFPLSPPPMRHRPTLAGSLDPATGIFYRTPEHPRLRTAQACEKCRTRKAKCSGEHPSCKRCITRGLVCEYAKEGRVRGPNKPKSGRPMGSSSMEFASDPTAVSPTKDGGQSSSKHTRHRTSSTHSSNASAGSSENPTEPLNPSTIRDALIRAGHLEGPVSGPSSLFPVGARADAPGFRHVRRNSLSLSEHRASRPRPPDLQLESASNFFRMTGGGEPRDPGAHRHQSSTMGHTYQAIRHPSNFQVQHQHQQEHPSIPFPLMHDNQDPVRFGTLPRSIQQFENPDPYQNVVPRMTGQMGHHSSTMMPFTQPGPSAHHGSLVGGHVSDMTPEGGTTIGGEGIMYSLHDNYLAQQQHHHHQQQHQDEYHNTQYISRGLDETMADANLDPEHHMHQTIGQNSSRSSSTSSILTPPPATVALNLDPSFGGVIASSTYDPYNEGAMIEQSNGGCFSAVDSGCGTRLSSNITRIGSPNATGPLFASSSSSSSSSCTPTPTLAAAPPATETDRDMKRAYYIDDPRAPLFDQNPSQNQNQNVNQEDQNETPLLQQLQMQLQAYSSNHSDITRPITPQFQTSFSSASLRYSRLESEVDRREALSRARAQDSIGVALPVDTGGEDVGTTRHLQPIEILAAAAAASALSPPLSPPPPPGPSGPMSALQSSLESSVGGGLSADPSCLPGAGGPGGEGKGIIAALTMENNATNNNNNTTTTATRSQPSRHPEPHYAM